MFSNKKWTTLMVLVAIVAVVLSACAAPTPEIIEKEVLVEKKVVETVIVEREVLVEKPVVETVIVEKEVAVEVTREVPVTVEVTAVLEATPEPVASVAEVTIPGTEVRTLHSSVTDKDYTLYVALPASYSSSSDAYPVVYLLDGDMWFGLTTGIANVLGIPTLLGLEGLPELIIVGIGYATHDVLEWFGVREGDLSPAVGAGEFLSFIQQELTPYIDSNYRTDPTDRTMLGHSLGGLFSLYALFHAPETFNRYIAVSPSIYWDDVPAPVTVNVPDVVIGELVTVKAEDIDNPTLVTVPVGNAVVVG